MQESDCLIDSMQSSQFNQPSLNCVNMELCLFSRTHWMDDVASTRCWQLHVITVPDCIACETRRVLYMKHRTMRLIEHRLPNTWTFEIYHSTQLTTMGIPEGDYSIISALGENIHIGFLDRVPGPVLQVRGIVNKSYIVCIGISLYDHDHAELTVICHFFPFLSGISNPSAIPAPISPRSLLGEVCRTS